MATNVAAALSEMGEKVLLLGCSPKIDATSMLWGGEILDVNILEQIRSKGNKKEYIKECIKEGFNGILLAESGGPPPSMGCAGRGVKMALDVLNEHNLITEAGVSFVIYDVLGDVVCGGFAQPMRAGYAREVYIISSGELMSLYAANNICHAIEAAISEGSKTRLAGVINNMRGVELEEELVEEFGKMIKVPTLAKFPRDKVIFECEGQGGTVIEKRPDSSQAGLFRELAEKIRGDKELYVPNAVELEDITGLLMKYQAKGYRISE
jgi:nitrogenase iron protein NifH